MPHSDIHDNRESRIPACRFPAGHHALEEMVARGWSTSTLADKSGISTERLVHLFEGDLITEDNAIGLSTAFGTSSAFWLNLDKRP